MSKRNFQHMEKAALFGGRCGLARNLNKVRNKVMYLLLILARDKQVVLPQKMGRFWKEMVLTATWDTVHQSEKYWR